MTICIAALADNGRACVVAADREVTMGFPLNIGFEHHERKIDSLATSCVILNAGNALIAAETVGRAKRSVAASGTKDVTAMAQMVRDTYMAVHMERAEQTILVPRGLTLAEFKTQGVQQLPAQLHQAIDQLFFNFGLNTEFLIAGTDDSGGHIGWVHYHGMQGLGWLEFFDKFGYQAIGSGASHAAILLSLTGQHRDLSVPETVYNVFCAKVNAEVAPGVGDSTDIAVLTAGGIEFLTPEFLEQLEEAREEATQRQAPKLDDLFARRGVKKK